MHRSHSQANTINPHTVYQRTCKAMSKDPTGPTHWLAVTLSLHVTTGLLDFFLLVFALSNAPYVASDG